MPKLFITKTVTGINYGNEETRDYFSRIDVNDGVVGNFKKPRNYEHHKKFFALINFAHSNRPESFDETYGDCDLDAFRSLVIVMAGYYDISVSITWDDLLTVTKQPKSISFESMGQDAFNELYEKVAYVLMNVFGWDVLAEFEKDHHVA